jgi:hypothetical protein
MQFKTIFTRGVQRKSVGEGGQHLMFCSFQYWPPAFANTMLGVAFASVCFYPRENLFKFPFPCCYCDHKVVSIFNRCCDLVAIYR